MRGTLQENTTLIGQNRLSYEGVYRERETDKRVHVKLSDDPSLGQLMTTGGITEHLTITNVKGASDIINSPSRGEGKVSADRRDIVFPAATWRRMLTIIDSSEKSPPSHYDCSAKNEDHRRDFLEIKLKQGVPTGLRFEGFWWDRWLGTYETYDVNFQKIADRLLTYNPDNPTSMYKIATGADTYHEV